MLQSFNKALWHMYSMSIQVTLQGTGETLTASAQHNGEANIAKQQAALDLVHQLQQAILTMLTASQPDKANTTAMHSSTDSTSSPALTVIHAGDVENSMPEIGNVIKVEYQLTLYEETQEGSASDTPQQATDNMDITITGSGEFLLTARTSQT